MPSAVKTKSEFYRRWVRGEFGNRIGASDNWRDLQCPSLCIRYKQPGSPFCCYDIPRAEVESKVQEYVAQGASRSLMTFSEVAPDRDLVLQGEVMASDRHVDLTYSTIRKMMRYALKEESRSLSGLRAKLLLKSTCDAASYDHLLDLIEQYPGHVVEFSTYRYPVGDLHRNTLVWEVRAY